jgi:hypothetical protein
MDGTEWKVDNHLNTMTITFPTSPGVVIRWTADQVDDHLRKLGELRSKMKPPHPRNFAPGQVVRAIANASWATETDTMLGNSLLHIRDPRYGWLHFVFSKEDVRKLATLLQKQVIIRGRDKDESRVNQMVLIRKARAFTRQAAMIRKLKSGGYRLYSRKANPKTGRRRNLGTFKTRAAAEKHERAVQYFKRH